MYIFDDDTTIAVFISGVLFLHGGPAVVVGAAAPLLPLLPLAVAAAAAAPPGSRPAPSVVLRLTIPAAAPPIVLTATRTAAAPVVSAVTCGKFANLSRIKSKFFPKVLFDSFLLPDIQTINPLQQTNVSKKYIVGDLYPATDMSHRTLLLLGFSWTLQYNTHI